MVVAAFLLGGTHLSAATINFDDIDASLGDVPLDALSPYQNYDWINFSAYTSVPGFPGFNNGIVSGPKAAYTAGDALGTPLVSEITSPTAFNFVSGDLGSGWYDGLSVTLTGIYSGARKFSQTVTVNTFAPQFFTFNFTAINELDVFATATLTTTDPYGCGASGCSQITLDDLTLTPAPEPAVAPEPSTIALGAFGISVLLLSRHKTRIR